MSFWLDDDDIDDGGLGNLMSQSQSQSQQLSQEQSQSQSQRRLSQATAAVWHCGECGGLESYTDGATGETICSDCFTASQKKNDDQTDMDYEDVMGLAAKTRGGALVQQRRSRKSVSGSSARNQTPKLPLEDLDKSVVLPNLDQCMAGFMTVCRAWIRILVQDLRVFGSNNEETMAARMLQLENTVETLWLTYLRAWADGAEHYGELAPDTRFSMRDCFLSIGQRELIFRNISDRVDKEIKKNSNKNDDGNSSDSSDSSSDSNTSRNLLASDNEDVDEGGNGANGNDGTKKIRGGIIGNVLRVHGRLRRKGRKEAALYLPPSMTNAAALVWLAVHRMCTTTKTTDSSSLSTASSAASRPTIITSRQFITWLVNGSLPLYSTFSLLTPELQRVLRPIKSFFTCKLLPTVATLEIAATLWTVACGLKSVTQWNGTNAYLEPEEVESRRVQARIEKITPKTRKNAAKKKVPKKGDLAAEGLRFVTPQSVPVVAAQLIADTGLSQEVLNWALAIMGCSKPTPYQLAVMAALTEAAYQFGDVLKAPELPVSIDPVTGRIVLPDIRPDHESPPLRTRGVTPFAIQRQDVANVVVTLPWPQADPIHLTTCAHIVAVILYASQLCPNWRTAWTYNYQHLQQRDRHADDGTNKSDKRNRGIPWNAQQFSRLVGNGSTVADYLDFYEETLRDDDNTLAPDFVNRLDTTPSFLTMTATKTAPASRSDRGRRRRISSDDGEDEDDASVDDASVDDASADEREHDHGRVVRPCTQLAGVHRPPPPERPPKEKSAAQLNKEQAQLKKKEQAQLKKEEAQLKKEEAQLKKEEAQLKKESAALLKKEQAQLKKEEAQLKKELAQLNKDQEPKRTCVKKVPMGVDPKSAAEIARVLHLGADPQSAAEIAKVLSEPDPKSAAEIAIILQLQEEQEPEQPPEKEPPAVDSFASEFGVALTQLASVPQPSPQVRKKGRSDEEKQRRRRQEQQQRQQRQQEPKLKTGRSYEEKIAKELRGRKWLAAELQRQKGLAAELQKQKEPNQTAERPPKKAKINGFRGVLGIALPQERLESDLAAKVAVGRLVFDPTNLDVDQRLLLEFLAYTSRLDASLIMHAYVKVFWSMKLNSATYRT
jgi:hypothetical protein